MLQPSKTKYRKEHRRRGTGFSGSAKGGSRVSFGQYGLKALECAEINSRQIEAARRTISRAIKRGGKVWIRIFPNKPISRSGAEKPMGSGKGSVDHYAYVVKPGCVLFEMEGVTAQIAKEALHLASYKLPIKCKVISQD